MFFQVFLVILVKLDKQKTAGFTSDGRFSQLEFVNYF